MIKDFIPSQESLELTSIGFNEDCLAYFEKDVLTHGMLSEIGKRRYLIAPTFSQAFRFFRENYNLSGNIDCCDKLCEWNIKSSKLDESIFSNKIQSYEEAELECLRKLISIVKQKQNE